MRSEIERGLITGLKKSWENFLWIVKIIVPISFLITLFQWAGVISRLDFLFKPLMKLMNLPGEAALPVISGLLISPYASIAAMSALPFSLGQMTLIAIFTEIAHSLIPEGIIQMRCGMGVTKITLIRLIVAILAVLICGRFFEATAESVVTPSGLAVSQSLIRTLKTWVGDTLWLLFKILVILLFIMITLEFLGAAGWVNYLLRLLSPLMRLLGLAERAGMPWLTASVFGLTYGGAVIIEEAKKGALTKEELEYLHISIGINHSMVEGPALLMALGLNPIWVWLPRLAAAIIAVQGYRALHYLKRLSLRYLATKKEKLP